MSSWSLRVGAVALFTGAVATISGCSGKVLEGTPTAGLPPGCEGVLVERGAGAATCGPSPARCARVQQDSKSEYEFSISFAPMVDSKAANCLAAFLKSRGGQATVESWGGLSVTGSYAVIEPALAYSIVDSYLVLTCAGGCTRCSGLSTDTCAQDAFCAPITGRKFNSASTCLEASTAIGCGEAPNGCIPEGSAVLDPEGACWVVDCSGMPERWTATGGQLCPGSDSNTSSCP